MRTAKREQEPHSYWFCFVSSLDRAKDVSLIKELLFWAYIYHRHDSEIYILIPGMTPRDYSAYRTLFDVSDVPSLVLTDSLSWPTDYVKFPSSFFTSKFVGQDYKKLRDTMDSLHNILQVRGSLYNVKTKVLKEKLTVSLAKGWEEINSLISIKIEKERPKILFLVANPKDTVRLRLDQEVREIEHKILLAQKKDRLILLNKGAVQVGDLQLYLNQERPTIVHFSGHGTNEGRIILEDKFGNAKTVPPKALARVFKVLRDNIRCIVLNACFSLDQARAISQHIDCVIGMSSSISDEAAMAFSTAFYLAIASERSVKDAFDQGINELMLWEIPEEHIPQLLTRDNVDPSKIYLFEAEEKEEEKS